MENKLIDIDFFDTRKSIKTKVDSSYKEWIEECTTHIHSCEGDMKIICMILYKYIQDHMELLSKTETGTWAHFNIESNTNRVKEILDSFCKQMNYDIEKAIDKCSKNRNNDSKNDVGEDAIMLAAKGKRGL